MTKWLKGVVRRITITLIMVVAGIVLVFVAAITPIWWLLTGQKEALAFQYLDWLTSKKLMP